MTKLLRPSMRPSIKKSLLSLGIASCFGMGWAQGARADVLFADLSASETLKWSVNTPMSLEQLRAEKDPLKASLLNIIPFGVGSFQQGDPVAGPVLATVDGVSAALLLYGLFAPSSSAWVGNAGQTLLGMGGLIVGRILGVTAPWMHYNEALTNYVLEQQVSQDPFHKTVSATSLLSVPLLSYSTTF